MKRKKGTK